MAFGNGLFGRLKRGLAKTQQSLVGRIDSVLGSAERIDEDLYDDLEETLILADVGAVTASTLLERVRERVERENIRDPQVLKMYRSDVCYHPHRRVRYFGKTSNLPSAIHTQFEHGSMVVPIQLQQAQGEAYEIIEVSLIS